MNNHLGWLWTVIMAALVSTAFALPIFPLTLILATLDMPGKPDLLGATLPILIIGPVLWLWLIIGYILAFGITTLVRIRWPVRMHVAYVIAAVVTMLPTVAMMRPDNHELQFAFFVVATPLALVAATVGGLLFALMRTAKLSRALSFFIKLGFALGFLALFLIWSILLLMFFPFILLESLLTNW